MSKIQTWKQITTNSAVIAGIVVLYSICQRYKLESKLQLLIIHLSNHINCIQYVKDTNLKANYNLGCKSISISLLYSICQRYKLESKLQPIRKYAGAVTTVFNMSKIQTWKQITTLVDSPLSTEHCIQYVKDTNLKANYNYDLAVF